MDTEFLVHPVLDCGVVGTEPAFAFVTVAVVAKDHGISESIDVHRRYRRHLANTRSPTLKTRVF